NPRFLLRILNHIRPANRLKAARTDKVESKRSLTAVPGRTGCSGERTILRNEPNLCIAAFIAVVVTANAADQEVWIFDRLDRIGGHATTVVGHPRVIDSPVGRAIEFNGVDDGLLIDVHPL